MYNVSFGVMCREKIELMLRNNVPLNEVCVCVFVCVYVFSRVNIEKKWKKIQAKNCIKTLCTSVYTVEKEIINEMRMKQFLKIVEIELKKCKVSVQ